MPLTCSTLCRVKLVPVAVQVAVPPPLAPPAATLVSDGLVAGDRLEAWLAFGPAATLAADSAGPTPKLMLSLWNSVSTSVESKKVNVK